MQFSEILGQKHIKNHLTKVQKWAEFPCTIIRWSEGSGTLAMAIAYAHIFYAAINGENLVLMKPAT
jgi:DNA polymerase-3 subunit delta'